MIRFETMELDTERGIKESESARGLPSSSSTSRVRDWSESWEKLRQLWITLRFARAWSNTSQRAEEILFEMGRMRKDQRISRKCPGLFPISGILGET